MLQLIENGGVKEKTAPVTERAVQPEPAQSSKAKAAPAVSSMPGDVELPVTPIRQAIAANMLRSKHEIPHAWTMMEVDVTNLVTRRNQLKDQFKAKEGFNLTFFAFFVKAVAQALKEFPEMNSMW